MEKLLVNENSKNNEYDFIKNNIFSEQEENIIKTKMQFKMINVKTNCHTYLINTRFFISELTSNKTILFLHGHGDSPSWRSWIKLALIFYQLDFNCYMIDMPGFGNSLVDETEGVSFKTWQDDGPEFYKNFLEKIGIKMVFVIARCGGAALTIRTICKYPELFENSHIFHNNMISFVPEEFELNVNKKGMKFFVTWNEDKDHLKMSVGYKWYNKKRKAGVNYLNFIDITEADYFTHYFKNPSHKPGQRRLIHYQIMDFSQKYLDCVIYFITNNKFKEF